MSELQACGIPALPESPMGCFFTLQGAVRASASPRPPMAAAAEAGSLKIGFLGLGIMGHSHGPEPDQARGTQ